MPKPILVIYTGGTIGSRPKDPDPDSPQIVVPWDEFKASMREVERLGYPIDAVSTKPLDSCNVGPAEWQEMAGYIEDGYDKYAGFVILHGTDTMVYTASALSFMLRNLGKPVVITGAQKSAMVDIRNDAVQNFLTAAVIANPEANRIPTIPEVVIYFGGKILRGNRAIKRNTAGYDAYETPNLAPLGEAGESIVIDTGLIRPMPTGRFNVRRALDKQVLPIYIYPGVQDTQVVQRQLEDPAIKAAVVVSFGSGNIPTEATFLDTFRSARERGVVVANVSQCARGPVELGIYETSAALLDAGFVSGNDMTLEAALTKLMVLLADPTMLKEYDIDERQGIVEEEFERSLAGEQSISMYLTDFGDRSAGSVDASAGTPARKAIRGATIKGQFTPATVDRALLRLRGATLKGDGDGYVEFRIFSNLDTSDEPDNSDPGFGGRFRKWPSDSEGLMVFDVTSAFKATLSTGDRVSYSIVLDTADSSISWERAELAVFVEEA